jgi:hypothetical protein
VRVSDGAESALASLSVSLIAPPITGRRECCTVLRLLDRVRVTAIARDAAGREGSATRRIRVRARRAP